uniref:EGF-like domain-containing protein n=1 Tax=Globodera rostochiensis TaxID=31243 RepID=A0A914GXE9_GLORO
MAVGECSDNDYEEPSPSLTAKDQGHRRHRPSAAAAAAAEHHLLLNNYRQQQHPAELRPLSEALRKKQCAYPTLVVHPRSLLLPDPCSPCSSDQLHPPPTMAPSRALPDSLSLLISSSSASAAYASGSLIRPPQPPLSCPPTRRKQQRLYQQQNGTTVQGGRLKSRKASAPARTSSGGCSRLVLISLVLLAFATLLPLAIFLIFVTGQPQPHHPPPSPPASASEHFSADYRVHLHHRHLRPGSSWPSSVDALPELLPVDLPVHFSLPSRHLLYTQLTVPTNSRLLLNLTLSPKARIVLLARQSLRPTPGEHDWQKIVSGDKLHPLTRDRNGRDTALLRQALISHFLTAGRWHFGFLNDREQAEAVTLLATSTTKEGAEVDQSLAASFSSEISCQFDCFGKGMCREGRCVCYPGYGGAFCEETSCPVLCSGNGMFSNGKCRCYDGFKGDECQLLDDWCEDPSCGGHGECHLEGKCRCHGGWTGPSCSDRECPMRNCAGKGICSAGKCFCGLGWTGKGCERRVEEEGHRQDDITPTNWTKSAECPGNCSSEREKACQNCAPRQCPFGCAEHGKCVAEGQCQCHPGWIGGNCQIEICPRNCSNGGQCELFADGWRCQCDSAHFGDHCQFGREQSCDDGRDNDGDGLTDCEDSAECCSHPSCASDPLCLAVLLSRDAVDRALPSTAPSFSPPLPFFDRVKFLFDGGELSVQRYADIRLLDPKRVSVLCGRIFSSRGGPLTGVRVSDSEYPQQGFSLSRAKLEESDEETAAGTFELALNGGGLVSVQFVRQPFGRLPLTLYLPPNRIVNVGTVWMDRRPPKASSSALPSPSQCVASISKWHFRPSVLFLSPSSSFFSSSSSSILLPSDRSSASPAPQMSIDSRVVSVAVSLPDSAHSLVYASNRANGARSLLRVQLLGNDLPDGLLRLELALEIDGKRQERTFAPRTLLWHEFAWDRQNAFWQREYGQRRGQISVGFHLSNCASPVWHFVPFRLDALPLPTAFPLPLWSLSSVHHLHPLQGLLQRGDDANFELLQTVTKLRTVVGGGNRRLLGQCDETEAPRGENCVGKREKALGASLLAPTALAAASDGSLFIGDAELIRRMTPGAEFVDTLLRIDSVDSSHPYFLAVHPFTNQLHISLPLKRQILRVVDVGHHEIVSGANSLIFPKGIAFDDRANLFVLDGRSLKKVMPREETSGAWPIVEEVLLVSDQRGWTPLRGCSRMAPLDELILEWPTALSWDPVSGQLFLIDSSSVIFRVDLRLNIVTIVAGEQTGCVGGGAPEAPIESIAFCAEEGKLFWTETNQKSTNLVKSLSLARNYPPGDVRTVNGQVSGESSLIPRAVAVLPTGALVLADQGIVAVRQIEIPMPEFDPEHKVYRVNSPKTSEQFEFDEEGRHVRTREMDSGAVLRNITYGDGHGELVLSIEEGQTELKVLRGPSEGQWTIDTGKGRRVEVGGSVGEEKSVQKINVPALPNPIRLQFTKDGLLESVSNGHEQTTFFAYDNETRLPIIAKFPDGSEFEVTGPGLEAYSRWITRIKQKGEAAGSPFWTLEQDSEGHSVRLLKNDEVVEGVSSPQQLPQLSLPALSLQWHFARRQRHAQPTGEATEDDTILPKLLAKDHKRMVEERRDWFGSDIESRKWWSTNSKQSTGGSVIRINGSKRNEYARRLTEPRQTQCSFWSISPILYYKFLYLC